MDETIVILLLVVLPLATTVLVVGAVLGPSWSRAGRWRPGEAWVDEPLLLTAQPDPASEQPRPDPVVAQIRQEPTVALANIEPTPEDGIDRPVGAASQRYGGARGRW